MAESVPPSDLETGAAIRRSLATGRVGTWHWDVASDAVLWDGALCTIYGLAPAEAPKTAPEFLGLVAPEDRDATVRTVSHGLEGAATVEHRFRVSVGGRTFWIHDRAHVIRDHDQRPTSMIGMCCEVTAAPAARIVPSPGPMGKHGPVDLAAYLATIVESLRRHPQTGEERLLQLEAASTPCPFDCAVKIGLILLELIAPVGSAADTAAGRRIVVSLSHAPRSATLHIADNGAGRADERSGTAAETGRNAAAALAGQIDGVLASADAETVHYFGTAPSSKLWRLDFPLGHEPR